MSPINCWIDGYDARKRTRLVYLQESSLYSIEVIIIYCCRQGLGNIPQSRSPKWSLRRYLHTEVLCIECTKYVLPIASMEHGQKAPQQQGSDTRNRKGFRRLAAGIQRLIRRFRAQSRFATIHDSVRMRITLVVLLRRLWLGQYICRYCTDLHLHQLRTEYLHSHNLPISLL